MNRCLAFLLLCAWALAGCDAKRIAPPVETAPKFTPKSEELQVDLLFDVTLSMQGFTRSQATSDYQKIIPLLEQAVITGWRGTATFSKFGAGIAPLPGREFLDATKPQFYSDSRYNKTTLIDQVIDSADTDHLTVVVTDLFQNNADVNQLSDRLKQKFFQAGLAVGVLGVRSQYDGTVFDVGPDNHTFAYRSGEKSESGRPFYLLALGSHANIEHYFNTLMARGVSAFPEKQALILSGFVTAQPTPFMPARIDVSRGISEISVGNILSRDYSGEEIKAFRITGGRQQAQFETQWAYAPLPAAQLYSADLAPEVTAWSGADNGSSELKLVRDAQAAKAFRVNAALLPNGEAPSRLRLKADLDVNGLPASGIYRYKVVLRPAKYSLPQWVADWTMPESEIRNWQRNPGQFDGARTFNLANFLSTLQGAVLGVSPPEVAHFYCDIRVDK